MKDENMNKIVQDISKEIQSMSGTYTPYIIFTDWCKMLALSISNACELTHGELWKLRETDYCNTVKRYSDEQLLKFVDLGKMLIDLYEQEGPYDALGDIYMTAKCGNKSTGQFFTPFNISLLTAQLQSYPTEGKIELNEPSCGAGGMILATAKIINERGGNAQRQLKVTANDLDWNSIYMAYVQLSLNGIDAVCIQGDTLANEAFSEKRALRTPKNKGVLL